MFWPILKTPRAKNRRRGSLMALCPCTTPCVKLNARGWTPKPTRAASRLRRFCRARPWASGLSCRWQRTVFLLPITLRQRSAFPKSSSVCFPVRAAQRGLCANWALWAHRLTFWKANQWRQPRQNQPVLLTRSALIQWRMHALGC